MKLLKIAFLAAALALVPLVHAQSAPCPAFVPASNWDGIAGESFDNVLMEYATIPANAVWSIDGKTCMPTLGSAQAVDMTTVPILYVQRTAALQIVAVCTVYNDGDFGEYCDWVSVPPTPDGTPYINAGHQPEIS